MENQPKTLKTYKNRHGTMNNQSGTIKTNLELYRVVKGGSGGYRRLSGGSAHFSLQTNGHTLHHNIYITITIISILIFLITFIIILTFVYIYIPIASTD